jgi:hypothetical protein
MYLVTPTGYKNKEPLLLEQGPLISKAFGARPTLLKTFGRKAHDSERRLQKGPLVTRLVPTGYPLGAHCVPAWCPLRTLWAIGCPPAA